MYRDSYTYADLTFLFLFWYIRFCFSYCVYYLFSSRGNLPLQSYWSLSYDHGLHCNDELMWEQQQCRFWFCIYACLSPAPLLQVYLVPVVVVFQRIYSSVIPKSLLFGYLSGGEKSDIKSWRHFFDEKLKLLLLSARWMKHQEGHWGYRWCRWVEVRSYTNASCCERCSHDVLSSVRVNELRAMINNEYS